MTTRIRMAPNHILELIDKRIEDIKNYRKVKDPLYIKQHMEMENSFRKFFWWLGVKPITEEKIARNLRQHGLLPSYDYRMHLLEKLKKSIKFAEEEGIKEIALDFDDFEMLTPDYGLSLK